MNNTWVGTLVALLVAGTLAIAAQQPPGSKTGNPTPGFAQPESPNLADRVTLTGCVQASASRGGRAAPAKTSNDPSDSRFVLTKAERKKVVPPGTGTSAGASASPTYRLRGIDSQLSPFVGNRVEISGEILPSTSKTEGAAGSEPILQVEFVQKLASTCAQP
jgi:hypothetical protein